MEIKYKQLWIWRIERSDSVLIRYRDKGYFCTFQEIEEIAESTERWGLMWGWHDADEQYPSNFPTYIWK